MKPVPVHTVPAGSGGGGVVVDCGTVVASEVVGTGVVTADCVV